MTREEKHIETLVGRYFEGATTNDEERELAAYFADGDITGRFQPYLPIFLAMADEKVGQTLAPGPVGKASRPRPGWRSLLLPATAAAMLLVVIGVGRLSAPDPFEGSFIVRDGRKITDLNLIRPELEAAVQEIYLQQMQIELMVEYDRMIERSLSLDTHGEEPAQIVIIFNDQTL